MLKVYRRVEPGEHPEIEIGRFLTERATSPSRPPTPGPCAGATTRWRWLQAYVPDARGGLGLGDRVRPGGRGGAVRRTRRADGRAPRRAAGDGHADRRPGRAAGLARGPPTASSTACWRWSAVPTASCCGGGRRPSATSSRRWSGRGAARPRAACTATTTSARSCESGGELRVVDFEGEPTKPLAERNAAGHPAARRGGDAALVRPSRPARRPRRRPGTTAAIEDWIVARAGGVPRRLRRPRSGAAAGARVREGDLRVRLRRHVPARVDVRREGRHALADGGSGA